MEVIGLRSDNLLIPGLTCIRKTTTTTTPEHEKEPRVEVTPPKSTSTTKSSTSTTQSTILTTQSKATTTQSIYLPDEPITTDSDRTVSLAKMIAIAVENYLQKSQQQVPSDLVIVIEVQSNIIYPEIQVESTSSDKSLKVTAKLPDDDGRSLEFYATVQTFSDGRTIDFKKLADVASKKYDHTLQTEPESKLKVEATTPPAEDYIVNWVLETWIRR